MGWQPFEHILPLCVLFRSLDSATCEVNIILHFIMKVFFLFFISKFGVWASHFRFSADNISKRLARGNRKNVFLRVVRSADNAIHRQSFWVARWKKTNFSRHFAELIRPPHRDVLRFIRNQNCIRSGELLTSSRQDTNYLFSLATLAHCSCCRSPGATPTSIPCPSEIGRMGKTPNGWLRLCQIHIHSSSHFLRLDGRRACPAPKTASREKGGGPTKFIDDFVCVKPPPSDATAISFYFLLLLPTGARIDGALYNYTRG